MYVVVSFVFWCLVVFFFCKQKTAYEWRISDWSADVCFSVLADDQGVRLQPGPAVTAENGMAHRLELDQYLRLARGQPLAGPQIEGHALPEIGRASCRERVCQYV